MSGKHPAIVVRSTPRGKRTLLASRPGLQVIDIISTWRDEREDATATARYFGINEDAVRAVLRYYADHTDEVDEDLKAHLAAQQNYERVLEQRETRVRRRAAKESSD